MNMACLKVTINEGLSKGLRDSGFKDADYDED
jgi:hypothetical protein